MTTPCVLEVSGNARSRGRRIGAHFRDPIRHFLADGQCRLDRLAPRPLRPDAVQTQVREHLAVIETSLPYLAEEIQGVAEGAEVSYADAALLQLRREILGYNRIPTSGDCSTFALLRGPQSVLGQTIDLHGNMSELATVLRLREETPAPEILMFTFAGLLGYLGLNSEGLAIGINLVLGGDWRPGIPAYLLVRHLLRARTVGQCLDELSRLPRASSRALTLMDPQRLVTVEFTPTKVGVIEDRTIFHTNHFLHPELMGEEGMNIFNRNGSMRRLARLKTLLGDAEAAQGPEACFAVLADHSLFPIGICVHNEGDIRREETVGAVVMYPSSTTMYVRRGNPCRSTTERFSLRNETPHLGAGNMTTKEEM